MRFTSNFMAATLMALAITPVFAADDIVIGQVSPLTGVQAETGLAARDGALLYLEKINLAGGINGRRVVLDVRDDEYSPAKTVQQAQAILKEKSPVLFLSTVGVANVNALLKEKVLQNAGVAMLGPTSGSIAMYDHPYLFPVRASYKTEVVKFLKNFEATGVTRLALVYQDDNFGKEALPLVEQFIKTHRGMSLVASLPYDRTNPDLAAQAEAVSKLNPQGVLVMAVTKPAASFIKSFRKLQPTTSIAVVSAADPEGLTKELGVEAKGTVVGLFLPHPGSNRDPLVREMHETEKALGKPLSTSPRFQLGYVTAKVAVAAIQSIKGPVTAASVHAALSQTKSFKLTDQLEVRFSGEKGINFMDVGMIGNNQFVY